MKRFNRGYTTGVYDMFHIGHLNIFKNAKKYCDFLIVGVSTDDVVMHAKKKKTIIPFEERSEIVASIRYVDMVVPQNDYSAEAKINYAKNNNIDVIFVGSDWKGTEKWNYIEAELAKINCSVIYLPHTDGISSSMLREKMNK